MKNFKMNGLPCTISMDKIISDISDTKSAIGDLFLFAEEKNIFSIYSPLRLKEKIRYGIPILVGITSIKFLNFDVKVEVSITEYCDGEHREVFIHLPDNLEEVIYSYVCGLRPADVIRKTLLFTYIVNSLCYKGYGVDAALRSLNNEYYALKDKGVERLCRLYRAFYAERRRNYGSWGVVWPEEDGKDNGEYFVRPVMYFDTPEGEQFSFHCFPDNGFCPKYSKPWLGKVEDLDVWV